jgi:hypothetical protein
VHGAGLTNGPTEDEIARIRSDYEDPLSWRITKPLRALGARLGDSVGRTGAAGSGVAVPSSVPTTRGSATSTETRSGRSTRPALAGFEPVQRRAEEEGSRDCGDRPRERHLPAEHRPGERDRGPRSGEAKMNAASVPVRTPPLAARPAAIGIVAHEQPGSAAPASTAVGSDARAWRPNSRAGPRAGTSASRAAPTAAPRSRNGSTSSDTPRTREPYRAALPRGYEGEPGRAARRQSSNDRSRTVWTPSGPLTSRRRSAPSRSSSNARKGQQAPRKRLQARHVPPSAGEPNPGAEPF